ncbi:MAG: ThuA domain-containing protein [Halioglobus sp.]|nr:ThuA domain-containing protein [Halioglobus sp.]
MDIINYAAQRRLLTLARGHPYERDAFHALTDGLDDYDISHVEQPAAQRLLNVATAAEYDALLCYDMPGVDFTAQSPPGLVPPDRAFIDNYLAMLDAGVGVVFMHHALAAWPAWDTFAEIVGGRFHYRPASLRGQQWPDSGYRHAVTHRISVVAQHPVTAGLPDTFEMTDELYLCPVFEDDVEPLLRSDYDFSQDNFYSAAHAVAGTMHSRQGWSHPPGSNLVGWVKHWGNRPIVYLQGGDDAAALADPHFRTLVQNAVRWVSSDEAAAWARARNS